MTQDDFSDDELRRVFDREPDALRRFIDTFAPVVRWAAAHKLRTRRSLRVTREDIEMEVWERLLRNECRALRRFDRRRGSLGRFMRILAIQRAGESVARHRSTARQDAFEREEQLGDDDPWLHGELQIQLDQVLAQANLSAQDWTLLQLIYFDGLTGPETAAILGTGVDNIYQRKGRLLARIRAAFERAPDPVVGLCSLVFANAVFAQILWLR